MKAMENNNLLKDTIVLYVELHSGETKFQVVLDKLLKIISKRVVIDSRRIDSCLYSTRFILLLDTINEVALEYPLDTPIPVE